MSSEPCKHERAPQSDVDAFGVLGDAGSRFEPGEADPAWSQWARDEIRRLRREIEHAAASMTIVEQGRGDAIRQRDALVDEIRRLRAEAARARQQALLDFANQWERWVIDGSPQTRGGAAYRARFMADTEVTS